MATVQVNFKALSWNHKLPRGAEMKAIFAFCNLYRRFKSNYYELKESNCMSITRNILIKVHYNNNFCNRNKLLMFILES